MDFDPALVADTNGVFNAPVPAMPPLAPVDATPITFENYNIPTAVAPPPSHSNGDSNGRNTPTNLPAFSASTAELIARARASAAANGTPSHEAARAQLMKNMTMSDRLPIPPASAAPKRGRGGRGGRKAKVVDGRSESMSTPGSVATPGSERGRGKGGRGRGRGRGGRGGKRKRSESMDSEVCFAHIRLSCIA